MCASVCLKYAKIKPVLQDSHSVVKFTHQCGLDGNSCKLQCKSLTGMA